MNRNIFAIAACAALFACKGGDDGPTDTDTDVGDCTFTIDSTMPTDGQNNVYYRTSIEFDFSAPDTSATVTVEAGGSPVAGASTWVNDVLIFTPNAPLSPSTTYNWSLSYCDGARTPTGSFTTGVVGSPVPENDLPGTTYVLDLASGRFVEPPGVGALLQSQLNVDILVGVLNVGAGNIQMVGAIGEGNPPAQDVCTPTIDFPTADFAENPYFEVGPQTTTLSVQGVAITIDDLFVSGAFSPSGDAVTGAVLAGSIDTRPLVPLVDATPGAPEDTVCTLVQTFGVACQPCTGGGNFCLSLLVDSIAATEVAGTSLVVRSETDIAADPTCQN